MESVIHDCCGCCPDPKTEEEREVAEAESKIYVARHVQFKKDDPGRQAIGSFNPLTADDWTDMAYIGNTQELCQKICDGDVGFVDDWCKNNPDDVDRRDHTGRTPLHLAAQCSTPEVLKCLVDHGARIVSRLVDGMTALHIASARGNADMVTTLLEKSEANEEEEADKEDRRKAEKKRSSRVTEKRTDDEDAMEDDSNENDHSDEEMDDLSSESDTNMTDGSFVKVSDEKRSDEDVLDNDGEGEPDIYDVNVLAWDTPVSPLHLAILGGHSGVIKTLVSTFGADALLPIKIINQRSRNPQHAIMTLVLAARLSDPSASRVTHDLLAHGASSAQADIHRVSAFHYLVAKKRVELLKACIEDDKAAAKSALNYINVEAHYWKPTVDTALMTAIRAGDSELVNYLLDLGAKAAIDLDSFASACTAANQQHRYYEANDASKIWREAVIQPIMLAIENDMPEVVLRLVHEGANINTIDKDAHESIERFQSSDRHHLQGKSVLDATVAETKVLEEVIEWKQEFPRLPVLQDDNSYLKGTKPGSYARWYLSKSIETAKKIVTGWKECSTEEAKKEEDVPGKEQRRQALTALKARFLDLQHQLKNRGAKTLEELHPDMSRRREDNNQESGPSKEVAVELKVEFKTSASDEVLDGYTQL